MCPRTFTRLAGGGVAAGGKPFPFSRCCVWLLGGVSCCRVVPLVAVLVFVFREVVSVPAGLALGGSVFQFAPVILGLVLWSVSLRLLSRC